MKLLHVPKIRALWRILSVVFLSLVLTIGQTPIVLAQTIVNPPNIIERPNIVFMMVDNFGYGDIGVYGGGVVRGVPTPNIDKLASEGLKLTNFNVEPECTPTRSALMTGRMPIRSGTSKVPLPGLPQGLHPDEYTLAELLEDVGYQSAAYGKWHLGDKEGRYPTNQGFDEWWGFAHSSGETLNNIQPGYSEDLFPLQPVEEGQKGSLTTIAKVGDYLATQLPNLNPDDPLYYTYEIRPYMDQLITDKAVQYIGDHAQDIAPFFLYVPFSLPHAPPLPHPDRQDPNRTDYQNVLAEIDYNAGRIIDAIDNAGIKGNTIVVWTSDNGPETHQGNNILYGAQSDPGPFRGEFPSGWEGAIRTPCIIRWPGHISTGRSSNEIVSILDFYATIAKLVGAQDKIPTNLFIDSIDQSDFFTAQDDLTPSNRENVMFFYGGDLLSIKWRNFKYHQIVQESSQGTVRMPGQGMLTSYRSELNYPWMFDIENDPKELWNIAPSNTWVGGPISKIGAKYVASIRECPNTQPGAETLKTCGSLSEPLTELIMPSFPEQ